MDKTDAADASTLPPLLAKEVAVQGSHAPAGRRLAAPRLLGPRSSDGREEVDVEDREGREEGGAASARRPCCRLR